MGFQSGTGHLRDEKNVFGGNDCGLKLNKYFCRTRYFNQNDVKKKGKWNIFAQRNALVNTATVNKAVAWVSPRISSVHHPPNNMTRSS